MVIMMLRRFAGTGWLGLIAAGALLAGCSAGTGVPEPQHFNLTPGGAVPLGEQPGEGEMDTQVDVLTAPNLSRISAAQDVSGRFVVIIGSQGAVARGALVRLRDVVGVTYEVAASELGSFRAESFPQNFRLEGGDRLSISQVIDGGPQSPAVKLELPDWVCSGEV